MRRSPGLSSLVLATRGVSRHQEEADARRATFPPQVFNVEKIDAPAGDAMLHIKVRAGRPLVRREATQSAG